MSFDAPSPLLPEILRLHGKWQGEKEAVVCEDTRLSWQAFIGRCESFASALSTAGLQKARVAILMENELEMVIALYGTLLSGCASVPINLSVSNEGMAGMLRDAEVQAIICSASQASRLKDLTDLPALKVTTGTPPVGFTGFDDFMQSAHGTGSYLPQVSSDDVLNIIYSSGTTGLPKGIVHTHQGRRDWAYDLAIALRYHGGARTLLTIGLYSNISWVAMLCTLLAGGTLVVHRKFDANEFLDTVSAEKITHTAMVPIQFQRVIEAMRQRSDADVTSMNAMMSCGSPLHQELKQEIFTRFPCGIVELYGLTEGIITTLNPEEAEGRLASVGKPLIGTDLKIIGADDEELPWGQSGEIVSRGRITMPGYLNRPEADNDATWVDGKGQKWLRSGDVGRIDEEGYLYIVDRKKDMILSGGQNIYPQDIEAVLYEHPAVNDVAVIAAKSKRWDETPIALVVPDAEIACDTLKAWCNERVGKQQRIADVIFVDELPRNPNGKILKRELRTEFGDKVYD